MSKHGNFKKHWNAIGRPLLECVRTDIADTWIDTNYPLFCIDYDYRIKGDKHWRLRQKWIDSGFTLPIENRKNSAMPWKLREPVWCSEYEYREVVMQKEDMDVETKDQGKHYRFTYRGIKLDPARICKIYGVNSLLVGQAIKKLLVAGGRGNKSYEQDLKDVICAVNRELEMIKEDKEA